MPKIVLIFSLFLSDFLCAAPFPEKQISCESLNPNQHFSSLTEIDFEKLKETIITIKNCCHEYKTTYEEVRRNNEFWIKNFSLLSGFSGFFISRRDLKFPSQSVSFPVFLVSFSLFVGSLIKATQNVLDQEFVAIFEAWKKDLEETAPELKPCFDLEELTPNDSEKKDLCLLLQELNEHCQFNN